LSFNFSTHPDIQEKAYNPYYTLVAQHLCANSHSYKITLQFTLWDFLRDLGERSVGGAEVVKSLEESRGGDFGDEKTMTEYRIRNIARLYAWLLAKNRLTLAILKVGLGYNISEFVPMMC
jgi:nucleolar MIF4G domain-containing protein 1